MFDLSYILNPPNYKQQFENLPLSTTQILFSLFIEIIGFL